jgi:hypothetical protein
MTPAAPLTAPPLRYLIGADDSAPDSHEAIVEFSYDATGPVRTRYGNLRHEKGRFDSLAEANRRGEFRPYLPPDDITGDYGEFTPDPKGPGFLRNVTLQVRRAAMKRAVRIELDNSDSRGLHLAHVLEAHDVAWQAGLHTIAKNPLNVVDPVHYLAHPSVDLAIVERGDATAAAMEDLRRRIGKPLLAVRFIGFVDGRRQDDREWCRAIAGEIARAGYRNMGVTVSPDGEYTSSVDVRRPRMHAGELDA